MKMLPAKKGTFYRKSFIWFLLTASIPGLITGGFIYWFAKAQIEQDLSELHKSQMEQRVKNIDDQLSYLEMDLSHWAFHSRFGSELQQLNFIHDFLETWDISRTLNIMRGSHPLIADVELFVDREQPVLFQSEYRLLKDEAQIVQFRELMADKRNIYWLVEQGEATESSDSGDTEPITNAGTIKLVHRVPGVSTTSFGVMVVTVKSDKLVNLLQTMTPYNEGITFLLDDGGDVVATDSPQGGRDVHLMLRAAILEHRAAGDGLVDGSFLWDWNGTTYSVSYGSMKRIGSEWTYVSASPMTAIVSPVIRMSNIIIAVSLSVLLLGLLLSWFASNWIYTPIRQLVNKMNAEDPNLNHRKLDEFQFLENQWSSLANQRSTLEVRLNEQLPNLRNSFLLQLIQGHLNAYSEEDLRKHMERFGWEIEESQYHIMRFQLTGYDNLKGRFASGDESLVTFVAFNIIDEIAAESFDKFAVMNFHDLSVAMFIVSPNDGLGSEKEELRLFGEQVSQQINKLLGVHVTITVSRAIDRLKLTPETFMEVERFTGYRKFSNQNQYINIDDLPTQEITGEKSYPFSLEQNILQSLRSGKQGEAGKLVAQFLEELLARQDTEIYVQQGMLQLLGSIQHMILQSGISIFRLFNGDNLFEQLSQIREPDKMLKWMREKVIQPYMVEREARANRQLKEIVEQTVEYIHLNYMKDISLDECADMAGTNSYTLSRLFKQNTGVNFIEYVTNLRIEKAKQLLLHSDKRINEVAFDVGYQQRYFNRIFKKHVGITPGQFRELSLQNVSANKN